MPEETVQRCPKCKRDRPESAWQPSQWGISGRWCGDCLTNARYMKGYLAGGLKYPFRVAYWKRCEHCGAGFQSQKSYGRFCSRDCKDRASKDAQIAKRRVERPADRKCLHCGGGISQAQRIDARFCSPECNSAAHGLKRGNGRVGPGRRREIERAAIIERDGGVCHICGKRCEMDDIHLDHVVPLARGGTHAPENLAVACSRCNLSKGAKTL